MNRPSKLMDVMRFHFIEALLFPITGWVLLASFGFAWAQATKTFELELLDDKIVSTGNGPIVVLKGDNVSVRWTTNRATMLHLHGYNIASYPTPEKPAIMRFHAFATGRFPIMVHARGQDAHQPIAYIEVRPE